MSLRFWKWLSPLLAGCLLLVAARAEEGASSDGAAYFEQHIRPLLAARCYACHSQRDKQQKGGLLLDRKSGWASGGKRGPAIKPGDAEASLLIQAVRYQDAQLRMPPDKSLPAEAVARLERWVAMGAPDPREDVDTPNATNLDDPSDPVQGRSHWAFRPLSGARPPQIATDWPRTPIDAFVFEKLAGAKLTPAADADRRTLLRRAYFQLIGLPPTREQMAAFLADERADAFERVIDELLASPRFGERWGRHWLDLARYADSNGLDENFLFREAWRYRNWVIAAVNADLPFDRFLTEQIAGDLLPFDSIDQRDKQRIAAGFLVIGPKVLLGNDPAQRRMDVADEQLDTIGRAVLGQTLGCARCHDHKFDPIPTADYYALAGIFTSTEVMQDRYMLNEQRKMERLVGLGATGEELNNGYEKYWRELPQRKQREKHAQSALEFLQQDNDKALAELAAQHADAVASAATDANVPKEQRVAAQNELLAKVRSELASAPSIPPRAMIPADVATPADEAIRLAGLFNHLGERVPRGFLRVVSDTPAEIAPGQSGRLQLAHWLTNANGAGPLAARVMANRVWRHLMGQGLVRTVDNFGRTGEAPSHPELLDYLAGELIGSNWSLKRLVRQIVLSRAFAMSSKPGEMADAVDPENRLLSHAHRRRLEPEALRDAMLYAAGKLELAAVESTVAYLGDQATAVGDNKNRRRTDSLFRSVYLPVIRNDLPELFDSFDFANPHESVGMRPQTMVATQGLFMLNDASVAAAAEATARRLLAANSTVDENSHVDTLFELAVNGPPSEAERLDLLNFVRQIRARLEMDGNKDAPLTAWSLAAQAVFASSRFQFLD